MCVTIPLIQSVPLSLPLQSDTSVLVVPAHPAPTLPEGGYDDEIFLSPPPDDLQCIICHLTVREPHLITCCGATICEVIIVNYSVIR